MFRTQFPDLAFIQQRSQRKIHLQANHQVIDPVRDGWPHCILNFNRAKIKLRLR